MTPAYPHRPLAELLPSLVILPQDMTVRPWIVRLWRPNADETSARLLWHGTVWTYLPTEAAAHTWRFPVPRAPGDWVTVDRADDDRLALDRPTPQP